MLKFLLPRFVPLYPMIGLLGAYAQAANMITVCHSSIYCTGELLKTVQLARIYNDSKTFVDLKLKFPEHETMDNFTNFMASHDNNPTRDQIRTFVNQSFEDKNELEFWNPPDFDPAPPILDQIVDPKLRQFAKDIISIWPSLGRKVTSHVAQLPYQYSFINVPNGFIVPGGRFKELYYWDSYWIIRGLLVSNMWQTARGMIENFLHLVNKIGYIPNGSRIYYLGRSQPPLLTWMVNEYFAETGDKTWLKRNIATVEQELQYWLTKKTIEVRVNGIKYKLLRYASDVNDTGPRPEAYTEDYENSTKLPEEQREKFYREIKSAAESGWDFSSRWLANSADTKSTIHATNILPVDLNSIFAAALQMVGDLRNQLKDKRHAREWWTKARDWRNAIQAVMWDAVDGVWYDYDTDAKMTRKRFYPSCAAPLWAGAVKPAVTADFVRYLIRTGVLKYPGGIPTSLYRTGEQWDYPNAWPPLQSLMIGGLERSGNPKAQQLAREHALLWVRANYIGYNNSQKMYEKYNCEKPGDHGEGGEYVVQNGFGWTNGIVLDLLDKYGQELRLDENSEDGPPSVRQI